MQCLPTSLPDVKEIIPLKHNDGRGFFSETYNEGAFEAKLGRKFHFVQDNHSLSIEKGTLRGLHFQLPPFAQDKLIRVVRGSIWDVALDLRKSSPTFGQHVGVELTSEKGNQLFVPVGFAHGFCTLGPNTEVIYKVTNYYEPSCDRGVRWNDPALGISWPSLNQFFLSEKDKALPLLKDLGFSFL